MVRAHRQWQVAVAAAALAAVGLAACGEGGDPSAGSAVTTAGNPRAAAAAAPGSAIPAVTVLDVGSGDEFALGSIVPSERPVLVWFWAPH